MDFWPKFEYHIRDRIPDFLIKLLKKAGYDTAFSIKLLNNELLDELESFANEQQKPQLQPEQKRFKLLPGHRATLLALPSIVDEYVENIDKSIAELTSKNGIQNCEDIHFYLFISKF